MTSPHYGYWAQPAMSTMQPGIPSVPPGTSVPPGSSSVVTTTLFHQTRLSAPAHNPPPPPPPGYGPSAVPRQPTLFYPPQQQVVPQLSYMPTGTPASANRMMMPQPGLWRPTVPLPQAQTMAPQPARSATPGQPYNIHQGRAVTKKPFFPHRLPSACSEPLGCIQTRSPPTANDGEEDLKETKIHIARQFISILESHGPQEPSSEHILNCFLHLSTYERKVVMAPGSIKAFLRELGIVYVDGNLMILEPNGVKDLLRSESDSTPDDEEMDSQQLMFEQKASQHNITIEVAPSRKSTSSQSSKEVHHANGDDRSLPNSVEDGEEEVLSMTSGAAWSRADDSEQVAHPCPELEECFYSDEESDSSDMAPGSDTSGTSLNPTSSAFTPAVSVGYPSLEVDAVQVEHYTVSPSTADLTNATPESDQPGHLKMSGALSLNSMKMLDTRHRWDSKSAGLSVTAKEFMPSGQVHGQGATPDLMSYSVVDVRDADIQTDVTSLHREDKACNTGRLKRRHVGVQVQSSSADVAINTVESELVPVVVTCDQAVLTEFKSRNRRLQVGYPRLGAAVDASTCTENEEEFIETIDSLQYDEMVNRALVAEVALVNLRLEMCLQDRKRMLEQIDTTFSNLSGKLREASREEYERVHTDIEDQMKTLKERARYNVTQIRGGAWLNTLTGTPLTLPDIPDIIKAVGGARVDQEKPPTPIDTDEFHDARSSPVFSEAPDSQPNTPTTEQAPDTASSLNPPAGEKTIHIPAVKPTEAGQNKRKLPDLDKTKRTEQSKVSTDSRPASPAGSLASSPSPLTVLSGSSSTASSTTTTTTTTDIASTLTTTTSSSPSLDMNNFSHLMPLLQPMMVSLARVNPALAMNPQLLQSTAFQHLLTMQQAGMVPGCTTPTTPNTDSNTPSPSVSMAFPGMSPTPLSMAGPMPGLPMMRPVMPMTGNPAMPSVSPGLSAPPGCMPHPAPIPAYPRPKLVPLVMPQQGTAAGQLAAMSPSPTLIQSTPTSAVTVSPVTTSVENLSNGLPTKEPKSRPPGFWKRPVKVSVEDKLSSEGTSFTEASRPSSAGSGRAVHTPPLQTSPAPPKENETNKTSVRTSAQNKRTSESKEPPQPAVKKEDGQKSNSFQLTKKSRSDSGSQRSKSSSQSPVYSPSSIHPPEHENWEEEESFGDRVAFILGKSKLMPRAARPMPPSSPVDIPIVDPSTKPLPASMVRKTSHETVTPRRPSVDAAGEGWPSLGGGERKVAKATRADTTSYSATARKLKPLPIVASSIPDKVPVNRIEFSDGARGLSGTVESVSNIRGTGDGPDKSKKVTPAPAPAKTTPTFSTATKSGADSGSREKLNGLDDFFDDEVDPNSKDEDGWQETGKRNKKKPKFKSLQMGAESKECSNFDRVVAQMIAKFPNMTRVRAISLIRQIRMQRGDFKGASMSEILAEANLLLHGGQRWKNSGGEVAESKDVGLGNLLYKTSICDYWKAGTCVNGDQCIYAHGRADLRPPPKHILCSNWKKLGRCPHNTTCLFAHGESELVLPPTKTSSSQKMMKAAGQKEKKAPPATAVSSINWAQITSPRGRLASQASNEDSDGEYGGEECAICCDPISQKSMKKLECGHEFHANCIKRWIEGEERTCPLCRSHALLIEDYPYLG